MKKQKVTACLFCNKAHKKCDGKRPCAICIEFNQTCVENVQRKGIGRPKKRSLGAMTQQSDMGLMSVPPSIKNNNFSMTTVSSLSFGNSGPKYLVSENSLASNPFTFSLSQPTSTPTGAHTATCPSCRTAQPGLAKFCNQCGHKLEDNSATVEILKREMEELRKKNEYLKDLVKMREFTTRPGYLAPQMWALFKYPSGQKKNQCPPAVYLLKTSSAFNKLLGYENLINKYLPDLVPKEYHKILEHSPKIDFADKSDSLLPKLSCNSKIIYQHNEGHYIDAQVNIDIYFDPITKEPTFGMLLVENVWPHTPKPVDLPTPVVPLESKTNETYWEPPPFIKNSQINHCTMSTTNVSQDTGVSQVPPQEQFLLEKSTDLSSFRKTDKGELDQDFLSPESFEIKSTSSDSISPLSELDYFGDDPFAKSSEDPFLLGSDPFVVNPDNGFIFQSMDQF